MIVDRDNEISFTEMGRRTPPTSICNNTQQEKLYNFTYSIHKQDTEHTSLTEDIVFPGELDDGATCFLATADVRRQQEHRSYLHQFCSRFIIQMRLVVFPISLVISLSRSVYTHVAYSIRKCVYTTVHRMEETAQETYTAYITIYTRSDTNQQCI